MIGAYISEKLSQAAMSSGSCSRAIRLIRVSGGLLFIRVSVAEVYRAATWKTQQTRISFTHTSYFLLPLKKREAKTTKRLGIYLEYWDQGKNSFGVLVVEEVTTPLHPIVCSKDS